jgi:hypothetical protein
MRVRPGIGACALFVALALIGCGGGSSSSGGGGATSGESRAKPVSKDAVTPRLVTLAELDQLFRGPFTDYAKSQVPKSLDFFVVCGPKQPSTLTGIVDAAGKDDRNLTVGVTQWVVEFATAAKAEAFLSSNEAAKPGCKEGGVEFLGKRDLLDASKLPVDEVLQQQVDAGDGATARIYLRTGKVVSVLTSDPTFLRSGSEYGTSMAKVVLQVLGEKPGTAEEVVVPTTTAPTTPTTLGDQAKTIQKQTFCDKVEAAPVGKGVSFLAYLPKDVAPADVRAAAKKYDDELMSGKGDVKTLNAAEKRFYDAAKQWCDA